jgi:type I restriction-modification system DNA methylase subunit
LLIFIFVQKIQVHILYEQFFCSCIEPYKGRVFDPCCGSGGMFVQSEKFVEAHEGKIEDIAVYGQESNQTTWRLCRINLAIRGIDALVEWGDSFHQDKHRDLKADYILANPPFNDKDWNSELLEDDARWKYGLPPKRNANFAWVHQPKIILIFLWITIFVYHLIFCLQSSIEIALF